MMRIRFLDDRRSAAARENARTVVPGRADGYLTVFLSLCLPLVLSLLLVLIQGARLNASRMKTELAAATAADSCLAEFHRELMEQYDLLMIDTSYGTDTAAVSNTEAHLKEYMEKNLETKDASGSGIMDFAALTLEAVNITKTRFAADNDGEALREQIYAYYSAEPLGALAAEVLAIVDTFEGLSIDTGAWSSQKDENETALRQGIQDAREAAAAQESASGESETEETESGEDSAVSAAASFVEDRGVSTDTAINLYSGLDQLISLPVLTQLYGSTAALSQVSADTSRLLSGRDIHTGDGAAAENSHGYQEADTIILDLYMFEKCGSFVRQVDKNVLKYQLEYILNGKETDLANLEKTAESLLLIRLGANLITIMQDSSRRSEAQSWGTAIAVLCLNPELESLFTTAILLIWTYLESLRDVRTLLEGGKVPLVKSSSEWKTGLTSVFSAGAGGTESSSGGSGVDYEGYLHILMFLEDMDTKLVRLMDLMELDIRATEGNEAFRMDWCMDTFFMEACVADTSGYSWSVQREVTYN